MINQKESKQVGMGSWFLKLVSRDIRTKAKTNDQPTNNQEITKIKAIGNITPAMDQYPRNEQMVRY